MEEIFCQWYFIKVLIYLFWKFNNVQLEKKFLLENLCILFEIIFLWVSKWKEVIFYLLLNMNHLNLHLP